MKKDKMTIENSSGAVKIVDVDDEIIKRLRESGLSKEMKSLENCNFLAIIEENGQIIGASGMGGIFNVGSLQVHPNYQGRGLGRKLLGALVTETKRRNYSFIAASRNSQNLGVVKLHDFYGFQPVFRIKYSPEIIRDVIILEFNVRGKLVRKLLSIFNNIIGTIILVCSLKILRKLLFRKLITYSHEEFPSPNIKYAIKNFEKL